MQRRATSAPPEPEALLRRLARTWYWMPAVVLALGVASLLMIIGTNRIYTGLLQRDQVRVSAIREIQLALATSHLWLEEHVTGDEVDLAEVGAGLTRAADLASAMLDASAARSVAPLEEPDLRTRAARIQHGIAAFRAISDRRELGYALGEPVGVGSELDVKYDALFREVLDGARELEAALEVRQVHNRARGRVLFRSILGAWVLIVSLAVVGLWTRERRRLRAEQALRESQAQLLQAQKLDAVGRLAGGIAHDINNYLGAIRAQSELVQMRAGPEVGRKMETVIRVVDKASALIERLLAFSRQETIQPEVVDVNRVITEGVGPMVQRLVGEDVRLETHLDPALWSVKIDPSQIEQVIVNLVVNAREAMPTGGSVAIATRNRTLETAEARGIGLRRSGSYVELSVSDSGPGIPEEIRDKIFEPFFTTKTLSKSSGLGLSTVYGIVEQNGGVVTVSSHPGTGATFRILLPRSRESVAASPTPAARPVAPAGDSGTVLLVEDNDELRESTRAMIESLGYEVIAARSGEEALGTFDELAGDVDLVVTDVVMPGINGKELIDRLRDRRSDLRVLFVSGYTDDIVLRHGIVEGEVAFLKKPFAAEHLVAKIRELTRTP